MECEHGRPPFSFCKECCRELEATISKSLSNVGLVAQRMNCMGCNKPNPDVVDHNDVEDGILWCYCRDCDIWTEHACPPQ